MSSANGLAALLSIPAMVLWPASSFAQSHALTVRDAIEMQTFIDPNPFPAESYPATEVRYSPDKRSFAVVTQRGLIDENELESTIWVFDARAVSRSRTASIETDMPKPKAVVRMSAVANGSAVTQVRWLTSGELAFLGRDNTSEPSLFIIDTQSTTLKKITPDGQHVTAFDIVGDTVVYTAVARSDSKAAEPAPSERVITGRPLSAVLEPEAMAFDPSDGRPANLWVIRHGNAEPVLDHANGKPVQLMTSLLSLSPSGRSVVITQYPDRIPKEWEAYEPFPCAFCTSFRLRESPPGAAPVDALRSTNIKQYALVDLDTGGIEPFDAPLGLSLLYSGPEKAIWLKDSKSLILVNTYLPLEHRGGGEMQERLKGPCVTLLDRASQRATCIATVKREASRTGTASFFLRDVFWDVAGKDLVLSYGTLGTENNPALQEHPPEVYREERTGSWVLEDKPQQVTSVLLRIEVRQDLNEPPALFVSDSDGHGARKVWDPNPQLRGIHLGEVSVYRWKDSAGREWEGGLVKPPNYVPGHRYPMVIQTHGFNRHEFMTVGTFTTAFAARPIAATGIAVLQVDERFELSLTPQEAPLHAEAYLSAVDHLADEGLVDPRKVGLIGFSRTGYYTLEALTKFPDRFRAATVADSDFLGYMQRLLSVGLDARDMPMEEGIKIYGAPPFGDGLKKWIENAPAFNLHKVIAPVRIEAHDLSSVLSEWELYAGLRLQDKPVDMIQLPDAIHVVAKPLERLASEQGDVDWFDFWLNGHEDPDPSKENQYKRWRNLRALQQAQDAEHASAAKEQGSGAARTRHTADNRFVVKSAAQNATGPLPGTWAITK